MHHYQPGLLALLGSGETATAGSRTLQALFANRASPRPPRIAVLETPAGFEYNAGQVAGQVADFIRARVQHLHGQVVTVPARRKNSPFSPDDPALMAPLTHADLIFMGPGSPTYTVTHLSGTLAWHTLMARYLHGASLMFASAATLAISAYALPVYEIFKAGHDAHWVAGLNLLAAFGLSLVVIPHWNNTQGGADVDTRRCFMGLPRFAELLNALPPGQTIVGIDEHTALFIDPARGACRVMGAGSVTVMREGETHIFPDTAQFPLALMGDWRIPRHVDVPAGVAQAIAAAEAQPAPQPMPAEVQTLIAQREAARQSKNWPQADALRQRLAALGWHVKDTPAGPEATPTG